MEPMTASELAQRAAVPGAFVDRLVELGNLAAGPDGRFGPGDLHRTRLMRSSEQAGLPLEATESAGLRFSDLGPVGLKGIPQPVRAYAAAAADDPTA
jgi:hypothetical protein